MKKPEYNPNTEIFSPLGRSGGALFADKNTENDVRRMWKICFDDSDEFIDLYFSEKYRNENTLIYVEDNEVVASLQMLPYIFTFCETEISAAYVSGACTLPEHRNKGYMGKLLSAAFDVMQERNIPLSILIPAEDWLYEYYAKYGYQTVFEEDSEEISLKEIINAAAGNLDKAYQMFDSVYRKKDFCVQKTKDDFFAIVKDAELDNFPAKTNLSGMARIIDARKLLSCFAEKYPEKSFTFEIKDAYLPSNSDFYEIKNGFVNPSDNKSNSSFCLDINLACRLLFGSRLEFLPEKITRNFIRHSPIMNFMLE